jgi:Meckel syndrome type 1 protein
MGGLMGGGGSGGGSVNPFASAGGLNAYGTQGPGGSAPWGIGDSPTAVVGSLNDPVTQAPMQIQGGQPPPAPDTPAPAGQQSGGSNNQSWMDSVSNILLGKDSNQVGSMQAQATGAGGGPPTPTQSRPLTQPGAAPQTGEPGAIGNPAGDVTPTGNANPAPAATPAVPPAAQDPAAAAASTPPAGLTPDQQLPQLAAVSPQSPQISGKKNGKAAPDTAAATPPTGPDQYSSQGYTEHGAGYGDTSTSAGAATRGATAAPGAQGTQGIGGKGNALGDLLQGNFGRFLGDLFGGQGMAGGAGQPAPSAATGNTSPPGTPSPPEPPAPGPEAQALPVTPTGVPNPQAPPPTRQAGSPEPRAQAAEAAVRKELEGYQPRATTPAAPGVAAAEAATPPGAPTTGATVGTPGAMTTGPAGAGFAPTPGQTGGAQASPAPINGITQFGSVPALTTNDIQMGGMHRPPMKASQPNVNRSVFSNEIAANRGSLPDGSAGSLMEQAAWMVNGEVLSGASTQARRIQLETAFNRAQKRHTSLANALRPSLRKGDGGYYDGLRGLHRGTYRPDAKPNAAQLAAFKRDVWDPVVAGSNYSDVGWGPMTGNASGPVAAHQFGHGTPGYRVRAGGDTYFLEDRGALPTLQSTTTAAATPGTAEQGARAMGFTPGQGAPEGRPLSRATSTGPQASSTTYEDELRNRGQANVARQLAYVPGAGQLEAIARSALQPTHIGKDFEARRPSLGTQAGLSDIERLLYGWGGPGQ